jgi:hypothetical protein
MDDAERQVESYRPSVHLPNLMAMASQEMKATGMTIGFQMAMVSLTKIAERAMEIGDEVILEELEHICIIEKKE